MCIMRVLAYTPTHAHTHTPGALVRGGAEDLCRRAAEKAVPSFAAPHPHLGLEICSEADQRAFMVITWHYPPPAMTPPHFLMTRL